MLIFIIGLSILSRASVFAHGGGGEEDTYRPGTSRADDTENGIPRLLLLSVDGFRYDYIEMMRSRGEPLVNLERLLLHGVYASMKPQFPSETFVNHLTLMTGLYPAAHGVVANVYYDSRLNQTFDAAHVPHQWFDERLCTVFAAYKDGPEPIWYTNERQRSEAHPFRRSGVHLWPCAYRFRGAHPTAYESRFDNSVPMRARIDRVLGWFIGEDVPESSSRQMNKFIVDHSNTEQAQTADASGLPVNFGMLYYEHVDEAAHLFGPESPEVSDELQRFDQNLGYLIERAALLKSRVAQLDGKSTASDSEWLNLVIVSDHGFASVNSTDLTRTFKFSDIISVLNQKETRGAGKTGSKVARNRLRIDSYCKLARFATGYNVDLFDSQTNQPYTLTDSDMAALNSFHPAVHVYYVDDRQSPYSVPAEFRYTAASQSLVTSRLRSVLFLVDPGYLILNDYRSGGIEDTYGTHGYNQSEPTMRAILVAQGPAFRSNFRLPADEPIENVDLYPLLCAVLQLREAPNNGSSVRAGQLLAESLRLAGKEPQHDDQGCCSCLYVAAIVFILLACGALLRRGARDPTRTVKTAANEQDSSSILQQQTGANASRDGLSHRGPARMLNQH